MNLQEKKNLALCLEGGGARGAYQIGAVKALYECGFQFKAMVGTSIGAINSAYLAQGDFEKIYHMWQTMSFEDLLDLDNTAMKNLIQINFNFDTVKYLSKKLGESIKNGGLDTKKEREILTKDIDEERLRNSEILYGLVATCLSNASGEELFIDEIPKGKVIDYIIASSNLPVFKRSVINDKKYLDGGLWDNCPVHMLEKKGFEDVIVIRAYKRNRIRDYKNIVKRGNITIHMLEPIDSLPGILNFDKDNLNELLLLGYYDALQAVKGYEGYRYYLSDVKEIKVEEKLKEIPIATILEYFEILNWKIAVGDNVKEVFVYKVLPYLVSKTKVKSADTLENTIIAMAEHIALNEYIDKYKVYTLQEFLSMIRRECSFDELSTESKVMYRILMELEEK